ncbi:uncharacterized protein LODBEIA_P06590 [Lodderomyces beijingensis]|uniref:Myotubularin phosphatase domain-containing protein n=1 Tax=Lodderomyces beijingensis TaxID=1775926 RepID=A0ABP0ZJD2_9ASCO
MENVFTVNDVILNRRGSYILGTLILSSFHLVFTFTTPASPTGKPPQQKEIWICYPIVERISKARGSTWLHNNPANDNGPGLDRRQSAISATSGNMASSSRGNSPSPQIDGFDNYGASHVRLQCKDFTYFSFDFKNDLICCEVFNKMSSLITRSKTENSIKHLYAYSYVPNSMEQNLDVKGWDLYDPVEEYDRLGLLPKDDEKKFWRLSNLNEDYKFCPSYPRYMIVPGSISDNVLKHAGKFRSKQRIPAVVYKHKGNLNGNVIARCAQPLVGLNLQNRSIQDEKLIGEIFHSQELERASKLQLLEKGDDMGADCNFEIQARQPQRNLIVDLRPVTNAMAQHALGAGTENVENYKNKKPHKDDHLYSHQNEQSSAIQFSKNSRQVDKIFCNIDNIHVIRDSLNKLTTILNDLDKYSSPPSSAQGNNNSPTNNNSINNNNHDNNNGGGSTTTSSSSPSYNTAISVSLQQALSKTQWLHRISIILQSVDRIVKSIHLNNTNVIIHCSDGWDRTSQVSALAQLCLDPFYRTTRGFMILIEKDWMSFGFKFKTRADHGGCIGATMRKEHRSSSRNRNGTGTDAGQVSEASSESLSVSENRPVSEFSSNAAASVSSFFHKAARAARDLKNSAQGGLTNYPMEDNAEFISESPSNKTASISFASSSSSSAPSSSSTYGGSSERSPVFHQFLDCIYQIQRQKPTAFEFNSRFLKRLLYHYYSCQYGSFLCDSERESQQVFKVDESTVSVWDYFNSRPQEFKNMAYDPQDEEVIFFNSADVKWWFELYGRSDEEMNGLSNSLDRKFAQMTIK